MGGTLGGLLGAWGGLAPHSGAQEALVNISDGNNSIIIIMLLL